MYFKPFVDWIWGGCVLMALGGLLAASDRRYRVAQRAGARPRKATAAMTDRVMKSLRFIIPLAVFLVLVGFLARRPQARSARGAVAADRQAGAGIRAAAPGRCRARRSRRDDLLGKVWVLNVWASWCGPAATSTRRCWRWRAGKHAPIVGLNYKDERDDARGWLQQLGDPYTVSLFDTDGRIGIDYRRLRRARDLRHRQEGVIRFKHIGPLTPR